MKPKTENYKRGVADGYAGVTTRPQPMFFKGREEYMAGYERGVFLKALNNNRVTTTGTRSPFNQGEKA